MTSKFELVKDTSKIIFHIFEKIVRPKTMKIMRDAYRARLKCKQVQTVSTKKIDARIKSGSIIGESNETY